MTVVAADRMILALTEASALLGDGKVLTLRRAQEIASRWDVSTSDLMFHLFSELNGA